MFPIYKSNNNTFFLDAKTMTSLDIAVTDFSINRIKFVHCNVFKVFTANDLRDTGTLALFLWLF